MHRMYDLARNELPSIPAWVPPSRFKRQKGNHRNN